MHHPTSTYNPEKLILDISKNGKTTLKDNVPANEINALSQLEIQEDINLKITMIKDIIDDQSNSAPYSSSDFTVKYKLLCYKAFYNLLDRYPTEMVGYLLHKTRSGGFQSKIFQEFISLLDVAMPFSFKKNGKMHMAESLLDDKLSIFSGISVFEGVVNDKFIIKNNTTEFYIGGRKASITEQYYIGKLLYIIDKETKIPLIDSVTEYTFSKIKTKDIKPGTAVIVTHLRIPPHYQMGGMVYVNRVRKKIIDRANYILKENRT
jgi:hypothetical protein